MGGEVWFCALSAFGETSGGVSRPIETFAVSAGAPVKDLEIFTAGDGVTGGSLWPSLARSSAVGASALVVWVVWSAGLPFLPRLTRAPCAGCPAALAAELAKVSGSNETTKAATSAAARIERNGLGHMKLLHPSGLKGENCPRDRRPEPVDSWLNRPVAWFDPAGLDVRALPLRGLDERDYDKKIR